MPNRNTLKSYFENGDIPNQTQYGELIDEIPTKTDDSISQTEAEGGVGTNFRLWSALRVKQAFTSFFTEVKAIAQTWADKQTFSVAPRFNSANANTVLTVDANKDLFAREIGNDSKDKLASGDVVFRGTLTELNALGANALPNNQDVIILNDDDTFEGRYKLQALGTATADDGIIKDFTHYQGVRDISQANFFNAKWWGLIADDDGDGLGTDQSAILQTAIDYVENVGGGTLFIPPSAFNKFYRIQKVYWKTGVRIIGAGYGDQNNNSTQKHRGTKFIVGSGGVGFVVGNPIARRTQAVTTTGGYFAIYGTANAISGLRIGADDSTSPANNCYFDKIFISDFTSTTAEQPVVTPAMASVSNISNAEKAADLTGACGLFISSSTFVFFNDFVIQNCNIGVGESSCSNCYVTKFIGGEIRLNTIQIYLQRARFTSFSTMNIEFATTHTLLCDVAIDPDTNGGKGGISNLVFHDIHFERVGTNFIYIRNQNYATDPSYVNNDITIVNSSILASAVGVTNFLYLDGVEGFYMHYMKGSVQGLIYTRNIGRYPVIIDGKLDTATLDIQEQRTIIKDRNIGINNDPTLNDFSGGLTFNPVKGNTTAASTTRSRISYNQISINSLKQGNRKRLEIYAAGTFKANDLGKDLELVWDEDGENITIARNVKYTNPNNLKWVGKVIATKLSDTELGLEGILQIGDKLEEVRHQKIIVSESYWNGTKTFNIYATLSDSVGGLNAVTCEHVESKLTNF